MNETVYLWHFSHFFSFFCIRLFGITPNVVLFALLRVLLPFAVVFHLLQDRFHIAIAMAPRSVLAASLVT